MKISLIVAMASNRCIGFNNQMPWHLSADLKRFKQLTMGSAILMGRKTYESIGRPLPGRTNIIISRNKDYQQPGCITFNTLENALEYLNLNNTSVFVIGGAELYTAALAKSQQIYLTQIHQVFEGDTFFPDLDENSWQQTSQETINNDPNVDFNYSFITLERRPLIA
ncbi:MAG: dihydrofolate reductase [Methylococcaceae bacterium]|jgi:dihydrofolate reductase